MDRQAVRAALISTMVHDGWPLLADMETPSTGHDVANAIRRDLDATVDQIQQHYRATPGRVFPAEGANAAVTRVAEGNKLEGLPPPVAGDRVERAAPGGETPLPSAGGSNRESGGRGEIGGTAGRKSASGVEMRFLDGQASAAGAVGWRPRLGQGERGAGRGGAAGSREVDGPER
ncbi:hypothetical protein GCM10009741_79210 [Kribbella lupini]|uniref:Uncharacterized protein n=1 Tax=Kribbella lupini TaxID=291602 RepID=A0ABN2CRA9_9ACTN